MGDSTQDKNSQVMLEIYRAIEERGNVEDSVRERALVHPDVEFSWPPALPLGGSYRGVRRTWFRTWTPLQPSPDLRRMDPRIIGAGDDEVVVHHHQRGLSPSGERFDCEVVGLYRLRDFKLARAQMFYFDEAAVAAFLARAAGQFAR